MTTVSVTFGEPTVRRYEQRRITATVHGAAPLRKQSHRNLPAVRFLPESVMVLFKRSPAHEWRAITVEVNGAVLDDDDAPLRPRVADALSWSDDLAGVRTGVDWLDQYVAEHAPGAQEAG